MRDDGFKVPPNSIRKNFPGERSIAVSKWEVEMLLKGIHSQNTFQNEHPDKRILVRPLSIQPSNERGYFTNSGHFMSGERGTYIGRGGEGKLPFEMEHGVGQNLWCQESWQLVDWLKDWESGYYEDCCIGDFGHWKDGKFIKTGIPKFNPFYNSSGFGGEARSIVYRAGDDFDEYEGFTWRRSTTLPRWASRIDLKITNVEIHRVHQVDTRKTGIGFRHEDDFNFYRDDYCADQARKDFIAQWNKRFGKKNHSKNNPWVYVISVRFISESEYLFMEVQRLRKELKANGSNSTKIVEQY